MQNNICILLMLPSVGIVTTRIVSTFTIVLSLNVKLALNDDLIFNIVYLCVNIISL